MAQNHGESAREQYDDNARWDMSDVEPFQQTTHEEVSNNPEKDPSLMNQEKAKEIDEALEEVKKTYPRKTPSEITSTNHAESTPLPIPERPTHNHSIKQIIKKAATATGNTALLLASGTAMVFAPVSIPLAFPLAFAAADSIVYSIRGVNGSMFEVDSKNRIKQRLNPIPVLMRHRGKTSAEIFTEETKKLFDGLKPGTTYTTKSHSMTYALLRSAQKEGRITDLTKEKTKRKSRLLLENIVTGNWKAIRSSKKHDIYNISFKVV